MVHAVLCFRWMGVIGVFAFLVSVWRNVVPYLSPDHHLSRIVLIIFVGRGGGEALKHLYTSVFDLFCISVSETESKQTRSWTVFKKINYKNKILKNQALRHLVVVGVYIIIYIIITITLSNATYSRICLIRTCWILFFPDPGLSVIWLNRTMQKVLRLNRDLLLLRFSFIYFLFVCLVWFNFALETDRS